MSLLRRQRRPLTRDSETLGDTRLFIIACDDTYAPKQYFGFFRLARIQIHVIEAEDGRSSAEHVLERLTTFDHEPDDELWMLLDTDHYVQGTHLQGFRVALQKAKQRAVRVALSRPCFELWLLLHHLEETAVGSLSKAANVEEALRTSLGEYNKTSLKADHYPLASVCSAYGRAAALDKKVEGGDIPSANTTRVYQLLKSIATKSLPWQLPQELSCLLA
jgi:hypothetical protein